MSRNRNNTGSKTSSGQGRDSRRKKLKGSTGAAAKNAQGKGGQARNSQTRGNQVKGSRRAEGPAAANAYDNTYMGTGSPKDSSRTEQDKKKKAKKGLNVPIPALPVKKSRPAAAGARASKKEQEKAKNREAGRTGQTQTKQPRQPQAQPQPQSQSPGAQKEKEDGGARIAGFQKAELWTAGYEQVKDSLYLKDYEHEDSGDSLSARSREFIKQKQLEINELHAAQRRERKAVQQETARKVAIYRGDTGVDKPGIGKGRIRVIFLGGLDQIGMNITAFESDTSIIVVDCGMAFPDETMPGIDLVIPDLSYLEQNISRVKGFFITHGHEDHIGALPYALRQISVPVYCTRLTRALIEIKLKEAELLESTELHTVQFGDVIEAGDFAVEFIKTNHSIQDAAALALHTPAGTILHTGDFKIDYTPVFGDTIDLQRFAELGRQGVIALLCDSTNAVRAGFTMSERTVGRTFEAIFAEHQHNRIIVATFASNVDRVQQVINVAEKYGRKVIIDGRSMVNVIGAANELGIITVKDGTLIDISEIRNYPEEQTVLVVTGSQGEPMAALSRMAQGQHRKVYLGENDVIVLSSNPIPGNEKAVSKVINDLSRRHTKVIYQDTHVSGHACAEDIKLIYSLVHPQFTIPVHGEYRHRLAQRDIALELGMPRENIIIAETGDAVELANGYCVITDHVQAGSVLVDGLGVGDVGNIVLRDRQNLAENGIIIAAVTLERATGEVISGPDIVTRGFVYVRENEDLIKEARGVVLDALDDCSLSGNDDVAHIRNVIKDELNEFVWRRMKRAPMILPIISEV